MVYQIAMDDTKANYDALQRLGVAADAMQQECVFCVYEGRPLFVYPESAKEAA